MSGEREYLQEKIGIDKDRCRWSYEVLRECGNLSSATILFALDKFLKDGGLAKGEHAVVIGVGPGLTLELLLLKGAP